VSVPLRTLAERASAEVTPRRAANLAELDGLLPAGTLRTAVLEIADPGNGSITRPGFLGVLLG
jgi:hypothetical protein